MLARVVREAVGAEVAPLVRRIEALEAARPGGAPTEPATLDRSGAAELLHLSER